MKQKSQAEILEDKTPHYKTKYQEIIKELITEIRELCLIEIQQFLIELWEENCKKEEEKSRKILDKKKTNYITKNPTPKEEGKSKRKNTNKRIINTKKKKHTHKLKT